MAVGARVRGQRCGWGLCQGRANDPEPWGPCWCTGHGGASARLQAPGSCSATTCHVLPGGHRHSSEFSRRAGLRSQGAALGSRPWRARPADPEARLCPSLGLSPPTWRLSESSPSLTSCWQGLGWRHCSNCNPEGPGGWRWGSMRLQTSRALATPPSPQCPSAGTWGGRRKGHERASAGPAARLQKTDTLVTSPTRLPEWGEASSRGVRGRPQGWPKGHRTKRTARGCGVWGMPAPGQAFDTFLGPGAGEGHPHPR